MISQDLKNKFTAAGQEHVFKYENEISFDEQKSLENQMENIDIDLVTKLYKQTQIKEDKADLDISPVKCSLKSDWTDSQKQQYKDAGKELINKGKYAVVTMAGGQGTRLGHDGPKGTYFVNVPERISLFEIQCNRLKKANSENNCIIPWYIMTSEENYPATKAFFEENNYFDYPKENVFFFKQYMLPMIDVNGKIILDQKHSIKEGADGHGGIFRAIIGRGVLADMKKRGVEWIFTCGIDNILVRPADEEFLGYISESGYKLGGKSLVKRDAYEKAGVFCKKNSRASVVEYTEIPKELAELTDESGQFVYADAHILCNLFHIDVFDKMGSEGLPYHEAFKKAPYLNENGDRIVPEEPNAYKFEAFIFDAFEYYEDMGILRVIREKEFAPIKNKSGEDSPESAQKLYLADISEE